MHELYAVVSAWLSELLLIWHFHQEIRTNIVISVSPEFEAESITHEWKTTDQGCATTLVAALDPEISGEC